MAKSSHPAGNGHSPQSRYARVGGIESGSAEAALSGQEEVIGEAVVAALTAGDAIFFGKTKDGSAVVLRVYSESGNNEWYLGSPVAMDATLRGIREAALDA